MSYVQKKSVLKMTTKDFLTHLAQQIAEAFKAEYSETPKAGAWFLSRFDYLPSAKIKGWMMRQWIGNEGDSTFINSFPLQYQTARDFQEWAYTTLNALKLYSEMNPVKTEFMIQDLLDAALRNKKVRIHDMYGDYEGILTSVFLVDAPDNRGNIRAHFQDPESTKAKVVYFSELAAIKILD